MMRRTMQYTLSFENMSIAAQLVTPPEIRNGSRDLTTPLSGMICETWAKTCYQRAYQIWSLLSPATTNI